MSAAISNLICLTIGYIYPSYASYRAIKRNESNLDLVTRLCMWITVASCLYAFRITDFLLGSWLPSYFIVKTLFVAWLVHPIARGAYWLFVKKIEPAIGGKYTHPGLGEAIQ